MNFLQVKNPILTISHRISMIFQQENLQYQFQEEIPQVFLIFSFLQAELDV